MMLAWQLATCAHPDGIIVRPPRMKVMVRGQLSNATRITSLLGDLEKLGLLSDPAPTPRGTPRLRWTYRS